MSDQTLTQILEQKPTPAPSDETADALAVLVGEGRKYPTVEALAKAYINADIHITELKERIGSDEKNAKLLDEALVEIRKSATNTPAPAPAATLAPGKGTNVSTEEIASTVKQVLTQERVAEKRAANTKEAVALLAEHYKDPNMAIKAVEGVVNGNANIKKIVDELGATDPAALLKFVTSNAPAPEVVMTTPGVSTDGKSAAVAVPLHSKLLTWTEAKEIRKKDPKTYYGKDFRRRMEAASVEHTRRGHDFFAT